MAKEQRAIVCERVRAKDKAFHIKKIERFQEKKRIEKDLAYLETLIMDIPIVHGYKE